MTNSSTSLVQRDETTSPRIYVACLAAYNNGILHGAWINALQDDDSIFTDISHILRASPMPGAEEYAIHDYEGFHGATVEEYSSLIQVSQMAEFISQHGPLGGAILAHCGSNVEDANAMLENYLGCFSSLADYIEDATVQCTTIPDNLIHYIDWEAMARDAEMSGDMFVIEIGYGQVHVFASY